MAGADGDRDPAIGGALGAEALERVFREEHGRLTAALVRSLGDWDLAEELVQDALVAALEHWPQDGIPDNPGAWLMTTARRKGIDRLRRDARYRDKLALLHANDARQRSVAKRYREIYGFDLDDTTIYDLKLDSDDQSPEALADRILEAARRRFRTEAPRS